MFAELIQTIDGGQDWSLAACRREPGLTSLFFSELIPDINRFDLSKYIANGFDISWFDVLFVDSFIRLVGYLLPWIVLGYYLIKYREVANPT